MWEWGGGARDEGSFPSSSRSPPGSWSLRREGLASHARTRRTAPAVAGKQVRVAGPECALPPFHPPPTFGCCDGSRNWQPQTSRAGWELRSIPCCPHRDPRAESPLFPASAWEPSTHGWTQRLRGPLAAREKFCHLCNLLDAN